jgi:hypothetical protein
MAFVPDRKFDSLTEAFEFILDHHVVREAPVRQWTTTKTGLAVPNQAPAYLFRGECGPFPTTTSATLRRSTYAVGNGRQLSKAEQDTLRALIPILARRFADEDYGLDEHQAYGLLQHYGIPTPMIDFTGKLGTAFAFAAAGPFEVGRVAALPVGPTSGQSRVIDLSVHPWAERPQRQSAFGIVPAIELVDLKSDLARSRLGVRWYEFPITAPDRNFLNAEHRKLVEFSDDVSAGFLRFHLTEYVEARGKFSPDLTDWLLDRIPIAPRCYLVKEFDGSEVIVNYRATVALSGFDPDAEATMSRRYWSVAHADKSADRINAWKWPPIGSVVADPRTYHPD